MSTLNTTNLKNESSVTNNIVLGADGSVDLGTLEVNGAASVAPLVVSTDSTERARIDSSGIVKLYGDSSTQCKIYGHYGGGLNWIIGNEGSQNLSINAFDTYPIVFKTSGTERARIDSSGRLLVGTSSAPSAGDGQYGRLVVQGYTGGNTGAGYMAIARGQAATAPFNNTTEIGRLAFTDSAGNSFAYISSRADAGTGSGDYPGRLEFGTTADGASSPTERMRITSAGDITGLLGPYNNTVATGVNLHITSAGTLKRVTSSAKYKTNIETLEDSYADNILNCRPVWYRALGAEENPEYSWYGFIAEEVAEIDPRLVQYREVEVTYDENGSLVTTSLSEPIPEGVSYERFVPHLVNLIKRQKEQIEAMEARLSALEAS